jgi:hypothetical protein
MSQNSVEGLAGAQSRLKKKWQRRDSNLRPKAYELTSRKATSGLLSRPLASFLSVILAEGGAGINTYC